MASSTAEQSIGKIDELTHAIASLAHVEKPYQDGCVIKRKLSVKRAPVDQALTEAQAKLNMWKTDRDALDHWTLQWIVSFCMCELASEKDRCDKGIKKAQELVDTAQEKVDEADEEDREADNKIQKLAVDYRSLQSQRDELTELLDNVFSTQDGSFSTVDDLKKQVEEAEAAVQQIKSNDEKLIQVKQLLKKADMALLEAVIDLRQSRDAKNLGQGQVYFPQAAYEAIKSARELYPTLPTIDPPQEYVKEADETGAFYSPMQRYLWEIRQRLASLVEWCDKQEVEHMYEEAERLVDVGTKVDAWNLERRRIIKDVILQA